MTKDLSTFRTASKKAIRELANKMIVGSIFVVVVLATVAWVATH